MVKIYNECNIDVNKARSSKFTNFKEWDKDTLIHGDHIDDGRINKWKSHIEVAHHDFVNDLFRNDLERWEFEPKLSASFTPKGI